MTDEISRIRQRGIKLVLWIFNFLVCACALYELAQPQSNIQLAFGILFLLLGIICLALTYLNRLRLTSYILLFVIMLGAGVSIAVAGPFTGVSLIVFVMIPVASLLFSARASLIVAAVAIIDVTVCSAIYYFVIEPTAYREGLPGKSAAMLIGLTFLTVSVWSAGVISETANRISSRRTHELEAALAQVLSKHSLEEQTSTAILKVTGGLNEVSGYQLASANEQAVALSQVTTTIEELSQTALQIAESAASLDNNAEQTLQAVSNSQAAVNDSLQAMVQIRAQVQQIVERTIALNERIQRISEVVGVVSRVAAEIHLLALNAAIEAAGAGEAGERFAVVAGEVKKLARRAQEQAAGIRGLVIEVQRANSASVMATEQGLKDSDKGAEQARIASEANIEVIDLVGSTTARTRAITLATQQQRSASQQVVETMRSLQVAAAGVATASGQIAAMALELRALATQPQPDLGQEIAALPAPNPTRGGRPTSELSLQSS